MNPNPSGLDPTARSFTGQYSQLQGQGNMYQMGSNLTGLQQLQGGLQSQQLGARSGFGGMPSSSSQPGERYQANLSAMSQYQQQAQSRHPGLALGNYSNPAARSQFGGTQLGMQNQGIGQRPLMSAGNMTVPGFGGISQNPQGLQGMQLWSTAGQQSMPPNIHSLSSMNRMAGLNPQPQQQQIAQVHNMSTLGQNISRDFGNATLSNLLQQQQQQQNPNPSQDLLSIMRYGASRQQQRPYGVVMQQVPPLQTQVATGAFGGGFGAGRSALPLERPVDPAMTSSALNGLRLDASEFPSLSGGNAVSAVGARSLMTPNAPESDVERSLTSKEEFPALSSALEAQPPKTAVHGPIGRSQQPGGSSVTLPSETGRQASATVPPTSASQTYFHGSHNMPASVQDSLKNIQANQMAKGPSSSVPGHAPSTPQRTAATLSLQLPLQLDSALDRFSLLGLNSVIMTDNEDLAMLALGLDLTQLGLKLDDPGTQLHKTFVSPWADHQAPGEPPEFEIPECYKNAAEKLRPEHLTKFRDETLFYMFYISPSEEAQTMASTTLISRGLTWHKDRKQWFMRVPNMNPQKSPDGERGSYIFFDTNQWKYVQKDNFLVRYDAIETSTSLHRSQIPLAMK